MNFDDFLCESFQEGGGFIFIYNAHSPYNNQFIADVITSAFAISFFSSHLLWAWDDTEESNAIVLRVLIEDVGWDWDTLVPPNGAIYPLLVKVSNVNGELRPTAMIEGGLRKLTKINFIFRIRDASGSAKIP